MTAYRRDAGPVHSSGWLCAGRQKTGCLHRRVQLLANLSTVSWAEPLGLECRTEYARHRGNGIMSRGYSRHFGDERGNLVIPIRRAVHRHR